MKATTQLKVLGDMDVTVTLEMTVSEMDSILEAVKDIDRWPMYSLKQALRHSLGRARQAYSSEHYVEP